MKKPSVVPPSSSAPLQAFTGVSAADLKWEKREAGYVNFYLNSPLGPGSYVFSPTLHHDGIFLPRMFITVEPDQSLSVIRAQVLHVGASKGTWLPPMVCAGQIEAVEDDAVLQTWEKDDKGDWDGKKWDMHVESEEDKKHAEEVWITLKENFTKKMTPEQLEITRKLIYRFHKLWIVGDEAPPPAMGIPKHLRPEIETEEGARPVAERRLRQGYRERLEVEKVVKDMLKKGSIEPSDSPWASAVVLVRKKCGSMRFCVDYRRLNAITKKMRWPLPQISELLQHLGKGSWFSVADQKSGFFNVPLKNKEARDKTSFLTHMGLFRFTVLGQGLTNAPAYFQRIMDSCLGPMLGVSALCYMDDLLVFSQSFEQHVADLYAALIRLEGYGLSLGAKKTFLMQSQFEFLGHVVTEKGLMPSPGKIQAVVDWPQPKNVSEVRGFLGLVNYYRRFIKDAAKILAPLTKLTRKDVEFDFDTECQATFKRMKEYLCSSPILRHPLFDGREWVIECDASKNGVGAVLLQNFSDKKEYNPRDRKNEHVICYYSRRYTEAEMKWSSTELESIGTVMALEAFKPWIWGMDTVLRTDAKNLFHAWNAKHTTGKLARWCMRLLEFDGYLVVESLKGRANRAADALSRRPEHPNDPAAEHGDDFAGWGVAPMRLDGQIEGTPLRSYGPSFEELKTPFCLALQGDRPEWNKVEGLSTLLAQIRRATRSISSFADLDNLELGTDGDHGELKRKDGLIWRYDRKVAVWKMVVPSQEATAFVDFVHRTGPLAHMGSAKTYYHIDQIAWWEGMRDTIGEVVSACDGCQKFRSSPSRADPPMEHKKESLPNARISVDIAGPFQKEFYVSVTDHASGFAQIWPVGPCAPSAKRVIDELESRWVFVFGPPLVIVSDQGPQFKGEFQRAVKRWGSRWDPVSDYSSQENAEVERIHKWAKRRVAIICMQGSGSGPERMAELVFGHNASPYEGTAVARMELFLKRQSVTLLSRVGQMGNGDDWLRNYISPASSREWKANMEEVQDRKERVAARNAKRINGRIHELKVGDWVLERVQRKQAKGKPLLKGPYPVLKLKGQHKVLIKKMRFHKLENALVPVTRLRKYRFPFDAVTDPMALPNQPPFGLQVRPSSISHAGLGVIATRTWEPHRCLGEYVGEKLTPAAFFQRYPLKDGKYYIEYNDGVARFFLDASDPTVSSFCRFINAPGNEESANVYAEEKDGRLLIYSMTTLSPGTELLLDYPEEFDWSYQSRGISKNATVVGHESQQRSVEAKLDKGIRRYLGRGPVEEHSVVLFDTTDLWNGGVSQLALGEILSVDSDNGSVLIRPYIMSKSTVAHVSFIDADVDGEGRCVPNSSLSFLRAAQAEIPLERIKVVGIVLPPENDTHHRDLPVETWASIRQLVSVV